MTLVLTAKCIIKALNVVKCTTGFSCFITTSYKIILHNNMSTKNFSSSKDNNSHQELCNITKTADRKKTSTCTVKKLSQSASPGIFPGGRGVQSDELLFRKNILISSNMKNLIA
ncbi:unnamed protein product [Amoebophrya sp. A120]|nr:unnamed protein product [Amoebophrya sp. A120]|eukprot:GSA120T00023212001.1